MSQRLITYLAVGVKLRRSALYSQMKVAGCTHKPPSGAKFCSECGKPVTVGKDVPLPKFDGDERYGGLEVMRAGYEDDCVIVGGPIAALDPQDPFAACPVRIAQDALMNVKAEVEAALKGEPIDGDVAVWLCYFSK